MSDPVESRIARIESDVQHIAANTADMRVEVRCTSDKIVGGAPLAIVKQYIENQKHV